MESVTIHQGDQTEPEGKAEAKKCSLCGLNRGRSRLQLEARDELFHFCCHGCLHVFQILQNISPDPTADFRSSDLFRACVNAGLIPAGENSDQTSFGKSPSQKDNIYIPPEDKAGIETVFTIKDLWCISCAWLIEEILRRTEGVIDAEVSFMADMLKVRYQPHRIDNQEITEIIERFGFHAVPVTGQDDAHLDRAFLRLGVAAILTFNIMMISFGIYGGFFQELGNTGLGTLSLPLFLLAIPVIFYSGRPILQRAWSMDILIAVGALTAFGYSVYQMMQASIHLYFDTATMLITMVLLGKFVENRARSQACAGINTLKELVWSKVRRDLDNREQWTEISAMRIGDSFIVKTGERVAADGLVIDGRADVDESVLSGESHPVAKNPQDNVLAGSLLVNGYLRISATRIGDKSSLGQMVDLIQKAIATQNPVEQLADRITGLFVPLVFLTAATTAAILFYTGAAADTAILRAVTILVIACPCALGIASPLAKAVVIAKGRPQGVVIRDPAAFELAYRIEALVFDKTGTVTEGKYSLCKLYAPSASETEVLRRMAAVEYSEDHFLAREIRRCAVEKGVVSEPADDRQSIPGRGVTGWVDGEKVAVGSLRFMRDLDIKIDQAMELQAAAAERKGQTVIFTAWHNMVQAMAACGDVLKPGARELVASLRERGIHVWLVSGDSRATTAAVATQLQIDHFVGRARPRDKVDLIRRLQSEGLLVGMIGDGINDSAALAQADLGFGVGGSPGNIMEEAADVTLLGRGLDRLPETMKLSRLLTKAVHQNLILAFLYNSIGIPVAALGLLNPFLAVTAMLASSLTVITNTLRIAGTGSVMDRQQYDRNSQPSFTGAVDSLAIIKNEN